MFVQASKKSLNNDDISSVYWFRFSIQNKLENDIPLLIELLNFRIDNATLYILEESGNISIKKGGYVFPFSFKDFDHKNFLFRLPEIGKDKIVTCFLRIKVNHKISDSARTVVRTDERFISYALKEYYFLGMFYGLLLIIFVYNIILFFVLKYESHILYVFYILSVAFYSLSWNGLGFQYLWPSFPELNYYSLPIASFCLVIFATLYARSFLFLPIRSKNLNKVFLYVILIRSLIFFTGIVFNSELLYFNQIDLIPILLGFIAGINSLRQGFTPARYYVIAYSYLFLGFFILNLHHEKILPPSIFTVYSLELGVVLELIFFSAALADRQKSLQISEQKNLELIIQQLQENERLKDKVNRELEGKVAERTKELQEANRKLKEQAEQITQMNLKLDINNRELQKNVIDLYAARVFAKEVEMEEFTRLYPNENACYKFLSNLKWENKYNCKKCGNDKFFWGKTLFARRCTKCGYEESVTAHTIFHP
jgi:hypothetical protein